PQVFGVAGNQPIDPEIVRQKFTQLAAEIQAQTGDTRTPEQVAAGFLSIAVENMANAIKKISVQQGHDVSEYTLCCFGAAGGQHACLIADALGMQQIFIHPYAGVLSAYGMGLADLRALRQQAIEAKLSAERLSDLEQSLTQLSDAAQREILQQGIAASQIQTLHKVHLRYEGTDSPLVVDFGSVEAMKAQFEQLHQQRYGFILTDKPLIVESLSVEAIGKTTVPEEPISDRKNDAAPTPAAIVPMYTANTWHNTPIYQRDMLQTGDRITGPAIITEPTGTNVIEPGWIAVVSDRNHLILTKQKEIASQSKIQNPKSKIQNSPDPVLLEIFNNLFMAIAEQMGFTLQKTSYSVNIKERLDFSCAIFDQQGQLVANAPHIPVHLGSMSESVQSLISAKGDTLKPGDVYVLNNPYNGGTHLPDITVITPVFLDSPDSDSDQTDQSKILSGMPDEAINPKSKILSGMPDRAINPKSKIQFYVASRGHHADIGGITPGSMPPNSTTLDEEGILIDNVLLVDRGQFQEAALLNLLTSAPYPVRNPTQNLADLQAQIAANEKGVQELRNMVEHYGLDMVQAYMQHVQDNAEASVRRVIEVLKDGSFTYPLDDGSQIQVSIAIDRATRSAKIDFTGTSPQQPTNFNAPSAVCKAAVLYVFRTLVEDNIPLNAGCLKPLDIRIPEGCMLNPRYPAAVVAGNVEVSQAVTDALYGALGVMAASQGTMNNFTFGNDRYQYYETICGGSGAGATFDGTDAVHTHMTNSRLTDPEVLEWRFPVVVDSFAIRPGSGGRGKHHGGNGVIRRIQFLEPMTAAILSSHRKIPPFGLAGGEAAAVGRNYVEREDGKVEELTSKA
ncbi:MAG TPA: hydantoinase B/oxoprolinase family protein, partial [Allocoleopsis sp.]